VTAPLEPAARVGPIDHVAVVVRSIEESMPRYRVLFGLEPLERPIEVPNQAVRVVFLAAGPASSARVELIEPTDEASGVARFLAGHGEGLHHVCLRSGNLRRDLAALASAEAELIDTAPRAGAHGNVAFIHPKTLNGVLWELVEAQETQHDE
jgi:methylmalonyl-CoA epimerase